MLFSSLDALLKLSKMTSPHYDSITLYVSFKIALCRVCCLLYCVSDAYGSHHDDCSHGDTQFYWTPFHSKLYFIYPMIQRNIL